MKSLMLSFRRLAAGGAVVLVLVGCAGVPAPTIATGPAKPRLVVFLVIDGLPQRQVLAYREPRPRTASRFLDRGAWFAQPAFRTPHITPPATRHADRRQSQPHRIIASLARHGTGALVYNPAHRAKYIGHETRAVRHQPAQTSGRNRGATSAPGRPLSR